MAGLNAAHAALKRVKQDHAKILGDNYYPIFLNWQTGGINAYADQIYNIRQGERVEQGPVALIAAQRAATPIYLVTDVAETVVTAPVTWINQGTRLATQAFDEFEPGNRLYQGETWDRVTYKNNLIVGVSDDEALDQLFEVRPLRGHRPVQAGDHASDRHLRARPPWNKYGGEAAARFFRPHLDFSEKHVPVDCPSDPDCHTGQGAFAQFFERLNKLAGRPDYGIEKGVPPRDFELSIVAHSMGTIVANDAVRDFDMQYDNLVYLAAASSIRHFYNTVLPMLEAQHFGKAEKKNPLLQPDAPPRCRKPRAKLLGAPAARQPSGVDRWHV